MSDLAARLAQVNAEAQADAEEIPAIRARMTRAASDAKSTPAVAAASASALALLDLRGLVADLVEELQSRTVASEIRRIREEAALIGLIPGTATPLPTPLPTPSSSRPNLPPDTVVRRGGAGLDAATELPELTATARPMTNEEMIAASVGRTEMPKPRRRTTRKDQMVAVQQGGDSGGRFYTGIVFGDAE